MSIRHDELRRELASKNDELSQLKQNFDEENLNKSKELTKLYNEFKKVSEKNKIYSEDVIEKDKIIMPDLKQAIFILKTAWSQVSKETIANCWKKAGKNVYICV